MSARPAGRQVTQLARVGALAARPITIATAREPTASLTSGAALLSAATARGTSLRREAPPAIHPPLQQRPAAMEERSEPKLEPEGSVLPPSRAALALPSFASGRGDPPPLAASAQAEQEPRVRPCCCLHGGTKHGVCRPGRRAWRLPSRRGGCRHRPPPTPPAPPRPHPLARTPAARPVCALQGRGQGAEAGGAGHPLRHPGVCASIGQLPPPPAACQHSTARRPAPVPAVGGHPRGLCFAKREPVRTRRSRPPPALLPPRCRTRAWASCRASLRCWRWRMRCRRWTSSR